MQSWYHIFPKSTGLSPYLWIIFCILPFYFIFKSSSMVEILIGVFMILLFFVSYRLSYLSKGWLLYFWVAIQIVISIGMTMFFGFVYFSLFLAFFIGNVKNRIGFFVLYSIQLITTIVSVNVGFFTQNKLYLSQFPFIVICIVGVILLPFNTYNRNKRERLEVQLEDANKRISELVIMEERQRISRDLHDTLGQKLSLIGLKSDLAGKLLTKSPQAARNEINDIRQTARTALKEVRELVSNMRGARLEDEVIRIKQVLKAAQMDFSMEGSSDLKNTPLLVENVLSMCLKEAVTNIVKHSGATSCHLIIEESQTELLLSIQDNGVGMPKKHDFYKGNGLQGMRERLEFVNGSLEITTSSEGTTIHIKVSNIIKQTEQE